MSIGKWIRTKFASYPTIIPANIIGNRGYVTPAHVPLEWKYVEMNKLMEDERIYSIVSLCASIARNAYKGIEILPEDSFDDKELTKSEKEAINEAEKFARKIDLHDFFFTYSWNVLAYGDYVEKMVIDSKGIQELVPLPLNNLTILESKDQLKVYENQLIYEANYYVISEEFVGVTGVPQANQSEARKSNVCPKEEIIHVSYNNRGQWRKDIRNRDTFGIYSYPPIAPLVRMKNWKDDTIETDKRWKKKLLPRDHWRVDVSDINPVTFLGTTPEEKLKNAKAEADKRMKAVADVADSPNPDQSVITTNSVESLILEPNSTSYVIPNQTIDQINESLGSTTGVPQAYLGGRSDGYAGLTSVNAINNIRMEVLVGKIKKAAERLIKKHLKIAHPDLGEEVIDRLTIQASTKSPQLDLEISKVILNYVGSGLFSAHELRKMAGYSNVVQEPYKNEVDQTLIRGTPDQVMKDTKMEGENKLNNNMGPRAEVNKLGGGRNGLVR